MERIQFMVYWVVMPHSDVVFWRTILPPSSG